MANWKEGDTVRVITRDVTEDDRKSNMYYTHMAGLQGNVEYLYDGGVISVRVDKDSLPKITKDAQKTAADRMRSKFLDNLSEEQKKTLTSEEQNFEVTYSVLVHEKDLEKA